MIDETSNWSPSHKWNCSFSIWGQFLGKIWDCFINALLNYLALPYVMIQATYVFRTSLTRVLDADASASPGAEEGTAGADEASSKYESSSKNMSSPNASSSRFERRYQLMD